MKGRPIQKSGRFAGKPYRKSQKAYAVDYAVSLPTVKRWWAKGLPCDDADAMGEHLSPRGRKAAEAEEDFESPSIIPFAEAGESAATLATPAPEPDGPVQLDESFYAGKGFLAEIEKLKDAAQERRGAYFSAIRHNRGSQNIRNRLAEWMSVLEGLRKAEKEFPGIRKANNQAVDRAEMEMLLGQTFQAFRAQATIAFTRLLEKLGLGGNLEAKTEAEKENERLLRTLATLALPGDEDGEQPQAQGADV